MHYTRVYYWVSSWWANRIGLASLTSASDLIVDAVFSCFHLGINIVFIDTENIVEIAAIGIRSEIMAKRHFSYLYGGHL